jgi:hypothetical protein
VELVDLESTLQMLNVTGGRGSSTEMTLSCRAQGDAQEERQMMSMGVETAEDGGEKTTHGGGA